METRKVIDLIESREVEVVTEWFKKFKNINFFNRDIMLKQFLKVILMQFK